MLCPTHGWPFTPTLATKPIHGSFSPRHAPKGSGSVSLNRRAHRQWRGLAHEDLVEILAVAVAAPGLRTTGPCSDPRGHRLWPEYAAVESEDRRHLHPQLLQSVAR